MSKDENAKTNEAVAGAQGSFAIAGKTYLIDQVTDQTIATLHKHLRKTLKSPLASIMESLKGMPEELQKSAISEAVKLQANGGVEGNAIFFRDQMLSANGCGFLFWMLARKNHPELTLEKCYELVNQQESIVSVMEELSVACGMEQLTNKGN